MQLVSAAELYGVAHALEKASDRARIERVVAHGVEFEPQAAIAALERRNEAAALPPTSWFGEKLAKLEHGLGTVEAKLERSRFGRAVEGILVGRGEEVARDEKVELRLADGTSRTETIKVVDEDATRRLKGISLRAEILGMIPFVGAIFTGGTALVSAVASLYQLSKGDRPMARSLGSMALKQITLAGAHFIPGGHALMALAALSDHRTLTMLRPAPSVAEVQNLAAFPPAALKG